MVFLILLLTVGVALLIDYLKIRKEKRSRHTEKHLVNRPSTLAA